MVKLFNGRKFARRKEKELEGMVSALKKRGVTPKLVSIVAGDEGGAQFYQSLKKKVAQEVGCKFLIRKYKAEDRIRRLVDGIRQLNKDKSVHGIMIQLPLPDNLRLEANSLIKAIDSKKDVDGMREDSSFVAPVVKAVLIALESSPLKGSPLKVVVVGAKGFVGRKIVKELRSKNYELWGVDLETKNLKEKTKDADVVISATGRPGLIKESFVKKSFVAIDVGAPKGDFDEKAIKKAKFATPVPGGIGPVTISCLLENLITSAKSIAK